MHEVGIPAAFLAGLVSFLSPCVLPLVPGYVSLISGVGIEELKAQETALLRKVMLNSIAFVLGFSLVFVTLGALSTEVGRLAVEYKSTLARVAGVLYLLVGIFGGFAEGFVEPKMYVAGDAAATAANVVANAGLVRLGVVADLLDQNPRSAR